MAYPNKIEYLFVTDVDAITNTWIPFWEVVAMQRLLDSMQISYELKKRLVYDDNTVEVALDKELPFTLTKGDIVSIYGASGKTSTLYSLASLVRDERVLCTTTTKMFYPKDKQVDYTIYDKSPKVMQGITFYGDTYDETKCKSPRLEILDRNVQGFDYVFIESDGTKRRPLKFYNEDEPIFIPSMNLGIIVCSLMTVGEPISSDNVHRIHKFCERYGVNEGDIITTSLFAKYLSDLQAVMKTTNFKRNLFFNKVESYEQYQLMLEVVEQLDERVRSNINIWFGSAHLSVFESLERMK